LHADWRSDGDEIYDLVLQAATRFAGEYGSHPEIYFIEGGGIEEPSIGVMTALHTGELIEGIPDRYATFSVRQTPMETNKTYYVQVWQVVLSTLLGWSRSEVVQWAGQHEDGLNGQHGLMFYHEAPCHYIAPLLIPQDLQDADGLDNVASEIQAAIEDHGREPIRVKDYNWDNARARLEAVVERFRREQKDPAIQHCCPTMSNACKPDCDWAVRVQFSDAVPLNTKYQLIGRAEADEGPCIFHCPWCGTNLSTIRFSVPVS
jgi:hypothetical protein